MLETLLKTGFAYHATDSERLARELEAAAAEARASPEHWSEFLRISTHTIGEHLADWDRARRLGEAVLGGQTPTEATRRAWAYLSVARLMAGDPAGGAEAELAWLGSAGEDFRGAALEPKFMLVAALVGSRRAGDAAPIYLSALDMARRLGEAAPHQTIRGVSGALATDLIEAPSRTPEEVLLMRLAADASHEFALKDGGWYDDFCGYYLKALAANVAAEPDLALGHVERGFALQAANEPSPIDEAFLHLTRAHAMRLKGDWDASREALAKSDSIVATWDKPGLLRWHAEERARAFPDLPPRAADATA